MLLFEANIAKADEPRLCDDDQQCDEEEICTGAIPVCIEAMEPDNYPDEDAGIDAEEPNEENSCRTTIRGYCKSLIECETDEDCGEASICRKLNVTSSELGTTERVEAKCDPQPFACETDGDCPSPLICRSKECHWEPVSCNVDVDCNENYACTLYRIIEEGVDDSCLETNSCTEEELSKKVEERYCFPRRVDCGSDEECPNGWSCTDFESLEEFRTLALGNRPYGPLEWQDPDSRSIVACLPDGLIAVFNNHGNMISEDDFAVENAGDDILEENQEIGKEQDNADVTKSADEKTENEDNGGCNILSFHSANYIGLEVFGFILFVIIFGLRRYSEAG